MGKSSHENTISQLLLNLLQEFGQIRITGLGQFELKKIPAVYVASDHSIEPPLETAYFKLAGKNETPDFLSLLESRHMVKPKLLKTIRAVLNSKISEFGNLGSAHIEGIGTIEELESGDLSLKELNQIISEQNQFLPRLNLTPITPVQVTVQKSKVNVPQKTKIPNFVNKDLETRSKQIPWKKLLWPALIFAIGIVSIIVLSRWYKPKVAEVPVIIKEAVEGYWVDTLVVNYKYKEYLTPDILEGGCSIVIGSFDNEVNAEILRSRAVGMGYTANISQASNMKSRVVVHFDCMNVGLRSYLNQVRSDINDEAWYLIPNIEESQL